MQLSAVAPKPLPASTYPPMNTSEEIEGVLLTNHKFDVFGDDIIGEVVAPLYAGSIGTGPLSGTGITRAEGTFDDAVVAAASLSSGSR
ncbi:MAG: hypothetical protein JWN72_1503, partial [Thermoleophilia bacterium]|nr:hypothetical protein [Thermoleophilia bacterium]